MHFALGLPAAAAATVEAHGKKGGSDGRLAAALDVVGGGGGGGGASEEVGKVKEELGGGGGEQVVSGMRSSADVLVWVDVKRSAREGGIRWWKSENGVVLTEGDGKGEVGLQWVSRVERRGTGEVIWKGEG